MVKCSYQIDGLVQQHLVEGHCKSTVDMMSVEKCHTDDSADKMEVRQVVGIDARIRVDLQRVNVLTRVQEQAVVRVQHLVGQQVEPLPRHAPVIESVLPLELDHQSFAEVFRTHFDDLSVRLFEDLLSTHLQSAVPGSWLQRGELGSENFDFGY